MLPFWPQNAKAVSHFLIVNVLAGHDETNLRRDEVYPGVRKYV